MADPQKKPAVTPDFIPAADDFIPEQSNLTPEMKSNLVRNAAPTQFEVERQGTSDNPEVQRQATQTPTFGTMARMIWNDATEPSHAPIVPNVPGGLGIPGVHPEYAGASRVADEERKKVGRGLGYRTAAALSPLAGIDAEAVEHAGDIGDLGAVTAHTMPQAAMTLAPIVSPLSSEVADATEAGLRRTGNATAALVRRPATAAQSQAGFAGSVRLPLPEMIRRPVASAIDPLIPRGEFGTATNPGPFDQWYAGKNFEEIPKVGAMDKLVVRPPDMPAIGAHSPLVVRPPQTPRIGAHSSLVVRPATLPMPAEAAGWETAAKSAGRLVLTPAEATAEENLGRIAARRARERGMQFAGGMVPREGRKVPRYPTRLPASE